MPNRGMAFNISLSAIFALVPLAHADAADFDDGPVLAKAIRKEFGSARGDYFVFGGLVSAQVGMGFGNSDPTRRLGDGNYLVSGCRHQSCDEKAAVIATPAGAVLAAGLINFPCVFHRKVTGVECRKNSTDPPVLTVFVKKRNNQPAILQDLKDWADGVQLADRKAYPGEPVLDIAMTEIRIIPERSLK
jgi:hypothetical protein